MEEESSNEKKVDILGYTRLIPKTGYIINPALLLLD